MSSAVCGGRRSNCRQGEVDPWDVQLDVLAARGALEQLDAKHRTVLTLRYLDGLSVREVATVLEQERARHRDAARARPQGVPRNVRVR